MPQNPLFSRTPMALLMVGASSLALATPAQANEYLFPAKDAPVQTGVRISQAEELTQISLTGGGTASFTDNAEYQINTDGSVELYKGTVTVAGAAQSPVIVRMPDGMEGRVMGQGSAANFSVQESGKTSGHTLSGSVRVGRGGRLRTYKPGVMWAAAPRRAPRRVVANEAQAIPDTANSAAKTAPEPQVATIGGEAGPVAAATNGIPVTLGDALAAAGASSDILGSARRVEAAVGNPVIETFPTGDFAALIARAAQIESAFGGSPFPQAQADIIRTYLRFLAGNGGAPAGADFLSSFSAFSLDYLDLLRAGGVPSDFAPDGAAAVGLADINAYLAFIGRTGALAQLEAQDRTLADAYLDFLRDGGNPDLFAASFTDLTDAYFAFVRGGGAPDAFQGASAAVIAQTIAFLSESGLTQQLSAADQALVSAFLANGGLAFASQFQTALDDYFAFLAAGNVPSAYEPVDQASLRQFLETLSDTGLLASVLGDQASFYADYLAFLRAGGDVDAFAGLPVNIFTDYAAQLSAYRAFLEAGNLPSAFTAGDPAQLQAFIAELQAAGALTRFTGADADFFAAFAAFVESGGAFDAFAGLNANIFAGYASDLQAYFAFLEAGGVPSTYEPLSQELIEQYLAELQAAGAKARFLPELAEFYAAYFAFVSDGGNPDNFAGLPVPPDFGAFAAALNAYADFLADGGFPADFAGTDLSVLASFIEALDDAGELDARLGANADLLSAYFAFLAQGGAPNQFAGLPIFADYVAELNAYFAFLANGGFPQDYSELDQATLNTFLAALRDAQGGLAGFGDLNAFFTDYAAFVLGGGDPTAFVGLPIYAQYVADLNAYFAFLANGGLPEDYTVLDPATLTDYLEALAGAQGGLASFAGLDDFFDAYSAFVLGGGDPNAFASLPVFAQYIADLNAYFAFLAAGGLPSEYTVLDQATLNAYLQALANAQGGLAGFAGLNGFFIDFFAFLAGGGSADEFPDLVANMDPALSAYMLSSAFGQRNGIANSAAEIRADGLITQVTTGLGTAGERVADFTDARFVAREFGRFGDDVAWTRYQDTATGGPLSNPGAQLLVGTPATNIPTQGTINYDLVGGTAPTNDFGEAGSVGFFTGDLAIAFGAQPLVGFNFDVTVQEGAWRTSTPGGAAGVGGGGVELDANGNFFTLAAREGLNGTPCPGLCQTNVQGGLFGNGGAYLGLRYVFNDAGDAPITVNGVAVFGTQGTALDGLGDASLIDSGDELSGTLPGSIFLSGSGGSSSNANGLTLSVTESGQITNVQRANGSQFVVTSSATPLEDRGWDLIDEGRIGDILAFSAYRITDNPAQDNAVVYYLGGPPAINLPQTGTITYTLIDGTAPSSPQDAQGETGFFTGEMAVAFGTQARIGINFDVEIDDVRFSATTPGGAADPGMSDIVLRNSDGVFASQIGIAGTSGDACTGNCFAFVQGGLFGDGASHGGFVYTVRDNIRQFAGTAVFEAGGTAINGIGTPNDASGGNMGGDTGGDTIGGGGDTSGRLTGFSGGFPSGQGLAFGTLNGNTQDGQAAPVIDANGALVEAGRIANVDADVVDIAGDALSVIGRFTNGTAQYLGSNRTLGTNNGLPYLALAPITGALPTMGTIDYEVLAATQPIFMDGNSAPGTFEGALSLRFGGNPGYRTTGTITMPESTGTEVYNFASEGAAAGEFADIATFDTNFVILRGTVESDGRACASTSVCRITFAGNFAGENPQERVGFVYDLFSSASRARIGGSVIYAPEGANSSGGSSGADGSSGSGGDTLIPPGFTGTLANQFTFVGNSGALGSGDASYQNGELVGFEASGQFASVADASGATISDAGTNADMAWARWSDGPIRFNGGTEPTPATFSYHAVSGNAAQTLPTSGTVNYDLIGSTPLTVDGSSDQGTLTGDMAIAFGTTASVGLDVTATLGARSWFVTTPGGAADPTRSGIEVRANPNLSFGANFNNVTTSTRLQGSGGACSDICSMSLSGSLFGENGRSASLFVDIGDRENGVTTNLQGLMLFGATGTQAVSAAPGRPAASVAPSAAPTSSAGGGWARWGGTGSASPQGVVPPPGLDLLPLGASPAAKRAYTPDVAREATIRQAEAIMGGAITFARSGSRSVVE